MDGMLLNGLDNSEEKERVKTMNMKECNDNIRLIEQKIKEWTVL